LILVLPLLLVFPKRQKQRQQQKQPQGPSRQNRALRMTGVLRTQINVKL
jgi:hypothetical protein